MSVVKVRGCFYLNEVGIKHDLNTKIWKTKPPKVAGFYTIKSSGSPPCIWIVLLIISCPLEISPVVANTEARADVDRKSGFGRVRTDWKRKWTKSPTGEVVRLSLQGAGQRHLLKLTVYWLPFMFMITLMVRKIKSSAHSKSDSKYLNAWLNRAFSLSIKTFLIKASTHSPKDSTIPFILRP